MRYLIAIAVSFLLSTSSLLAHEWSDATGKYKIEARLVSVAEDSANLIAPDGREFTIPLQKLSVKDKARAKAWLDTQSGKPPKLPENTQILATFRFKAEGGSYTVDKVGGFAIDWPGEHRPILVSIVEPFLSEQLKVDLTNIRPSIVGMQVNNAITGKEVGIGVDVVQLANITESTEDDASRSMTAFLLKAGTPVGTLNLADQSPAVDERVWLAPIPESDSESSEFEYSLAMYKVTEVSAKRIVFESIDNSVAPNCLGAAVVNYAGEVVGMHVLRGGKKGTIIATRVEHMNSQLKDAS